MDDLTDTYLDMHAAQFTVVCFAERLADFVIEERHRSGRPVQDIWREVELVASQSQVTEGV